MRSLLAGALTFLCCSSAESMAHAGGCSAAGFVYSSILVSRKRPRGTLAAGERRATAARAVPAAATPGSFTAERVAYGKGGWFDVAGEGRRRGTQGE